MNVFLDIVEGDDGVVELDLGLVLIDLFLDLLVAHRRRSAYGGQQLLRGDLRLELSLELDHAEPELVLNELLVSLIADEVATGEEDLAELSLVQIAANFFITDTEAHAVGLVHHGALGDHAVSRALHQERHQGIGDVAAELLAADHASPLRDLLQADALVANHRKHARLRHSAGEVIAKAAGDEIGTHRQTDKNKDASQDILLDRAFFLQKLKHAGTKTPRLDEL